MNKRKAIFITIPFLTITFGLFALNALSPEKKFSLSENRALEKMPTMTDLKEGNFQSKFEKYYNDQFVFRDKMLSLNRKTEALLNKTKVGNYYLVDNNWILGLYPDKFSESKLKSYASTINELAEISKKNNSDVYFSMTPHKTNILRHLYPNYVEKKGNIDVNINNFKSKLDSNIVKYVDMDKYMLDNFTEKQLESFYFKTDHHWNGVGAYEGFKYMIYNMDLGLTKETLDSHFDKYTTYTEKDKKFIGSYNRNLDMMVKEKEYPNYVYIKDSKYSYELNGVKKKDKDVIVTERNKKEWDYGGAYIRGAQTNILTIKNENALTDKTILLFRDSYQAPTTWLFADIFKEVKIVDPRNISDIKKTYKEIIEENKSDIVMFMYNSFGFDSMIEEMDKKGIK